LALPGLRRRAEKQLGEALALPDTEARRVAGEVFTELGRRAVELWTATPGDDRLELSPDGQRVLQAARSEGRGVFVLAAHLGPWELLAARLGAEFSRAAVVVGTHGDPAVAAWLRSRRHSYGIETIERGRTSTGIRIRRILRQHGAVGILFDQSTDVRSRPVPFFGRPAPTPVGMVRWAERDGTPVVFAWPREGGRIEVRRLPAEPAEAMLARVHAQLEDEIRRRPARWVWIHDRWRRR
jgi:KDO2-lipid IV(A) lauroyltransferase